MQLEPSNPRTVSMTTSSDFETTSVSTDEESSFPFTIVPTVSPPHTTTIPFAVESAVQPGPFSPSWQFLPSKPSLPFRVAHADSAQ